MKHKRIKFRVWDLVHKKIESVNYIDFNFKEIQTGSCYDPDEERSGVSPSPALEYLKFNEIILLQYTGLKDKNKKETYEGDIIKNGKGIIYEVKWLNYGFRLDTSKVNNEWTSITLEQYENNHWSGPSTSFGQKKPQHYIDWDFEVIGNIYENKELLK